MTAWAGTAWAGAALVGEAVEGRALDAPDGITTTITLPGSSIFAPGPEVPHYWAARSGRAGGNYVGAYLLLGERFIYWTIDGAGHNPGLDVAELAGLTGHAVDLAATALAGSAVATATAAVIDALAGWACEADGADIIAFGPAAITTGVTWDAADPGAMIGMRCVRGDEASYGEGGVSNVIAQYLADPGIAQPVLAVDILLGGTVNAADRFRVAFYEATGGATSPAGEDLIVDLGQIPADQITADGWARIYVPVGTLFTADQAMWCAIKSELNQTQVGGYLTGSALIGDWAAQELRSSDQGEASPMDPDATVAFSATWTGTVANSTAFVFGCRLIVASTVGNASHHSATDPAVWGVHVAVGDLGSSIDFNSNLACVAAAPPFLGMLVLDIGFAVGAARGTQPRVGVFTGGDVSDPSLPDPDGATLLVDGGRLTGSSTTAWENRTLGATAWTASVATAWWAKSNDDTTGTTIAFAQAPSTANADDPEAPMDFGPVTGADGPEYEIFPADSAYNVTDPAVTFVSPFVADPDDARPGNVPGARLRFYCPGITIAS